MADWRSFVKGLKVDGGASLKEADVPKEGPPKEPSDWKTFVAALGGSSGARSSGALDGPSVVEFNTETILEFKGKNDIANAYKKKSEPPRIRPNYDNSKRKFFANPVERRGYLGSMVGLFEVLRSML